jgi:hypothetical protein
LLVKERGVASDPVATAPGSEFVDPRLMKIMTR